MALAVVSGFYSIYWGFGKMNDEDRKRIDGLEVEMRDTRIIQNELFEDVDDIKTNHLAHIKEALDMSENSNAPIKITFDFLKNRIGLNSKLIIGGFAFLALIFSMIEICTN